MDDLNKERIRFNIEAIKLLTLLFITTGGGALALVLGDLESVAERIFGLGGMMFAFASGTVAIVVYKNTLKRLQ